MKQSFSTTCDCCGSSLTTYAKKIRANMIAPLRELACADRAMTPQQLSAFFNGKLAIEIQRHFPSLRLWHLIEPTVKGKYRVTEHGKNFLLGVSSVPEYLFTRRNEIVDPPEEAEAVTLKSVAELVPQDFRPPEPRREHSYQPKLLPA